MIIQEMLFKKPIENKTQTTFNPKPLKQIARKSSKLDDKELNKELAKKIIIPYYFTNRVLRVGFNFTLESHHINHANPKKTVKPKYPEFATEVRYKKKFKGNG